MMKTMRRSMMGLFLVVVVLVSGVITFAESPLISNVFDNTYLIDVLRDISSQGGVDIVADSTVGGQITMTLDKIPLEDALDRVLTPGGYVYRKINGYYLVGTPDIKNPSFTLLSETEIFKLRYTKAEVVSKLLAEPLSAFVKVDKDNNALVITAPRKILNRLKTDLQVIDRPTKQVSIEALVIDISKKGRKDLGLDWRWSRNNTLDPDIGGNRTIQQKELQVDLAYVSAGGLKDFLLSLKATVEKGDARIDANPRVSTLDGQLAEIFVGRERYYYLVNRDTTDSITTTTTNLETIKTGISLKMLPQVAENGEITVQIEPEVSDVVTDSTSADGLPVISRRRVSTTVRVKDGESIVLGGLIQTNKQKVKTKVPILGDIPVLGLLFSRTVTEDEDGEVIIIITPKIINDGDRVDDTTKSRLGIGDKVK